MIHTELIRPVPELLAGHARERGDKAAFHDARRTVTYEELFNRTYNLAGGLCGVGLARGDRAAIFMDNGVEAVESYLAITRAAGVGVSINPQASQSEVAYMLEDSGARVVLTDVAHVDLAARLSCELPAFEHIIVVGGSPSAKKYPTAEAPVESSSVGQAIEMVVPAGGAEVTGYEELAESIPEVLVPDDLSLDEAAFMLYTSGTTGRPKGVLLSQRSNLWVVGACWAPILGFSEDDHILSPLPLFHSFALNAAVMAPLAVGATEYVMSRFSTPDVLGLLREERITVLLGVPTMFQYLLQHAREEGLGAKELRACVSAGAIMTADLNRTFEETFGVPLIDGYGITETSTMVTENWLSGTRIMGYCGLPLPGSSVRIVEPESEADVGTGEEGELWVRGPHVMLGYHNRPEETDKVLQNGWYRTGDLACADEHGYVKITGRIKELIIRGGENIAPVEVEEVVSRHPAVLDSAVVGAPHDALGEVPVVFVVPEEPDLFDPEDLLAHCTEHLTHFKVPAQVVVTDAIPRTGSGKTMRFKLQQRLPHGETG